MEFKEGDIVYIKGIKGSNKYKVVSEDVNEYWLKNAESKYHIYLKTNPDSMTLENPSLDFS